MTLQDMKTLFACGRSTTIHSLTQDFLEDVSRKFTNINYVTTQAVLHKHKPLASEVAENRKTLGFTVVEQEKVYVVSGWAS